MRIDCLRQLLDITLKQKILLEVDEYEEFIRLLDEREELIDQINVINVESMEELTLEERAIVEQLVEADRKNVVEYNNQLEEAQRELKKLNKSREREEKYLSTYSMYSQGRHFDTK